MLVAMVMRKKGALVSLRIPKILQALLLSSSVLTHLHSLSLPRPARPPTCTSQWPVLCLAWPPAVLPPQDFLVKPCASSATSVLCLFLSNILPILRR